MGLFDNQDNNIYLENADLDCEPQSEIVDKSSVQPVDDYLDPGEKVHYLFTGNKGLEINGEKEMDRGPTRTVITDRRIFIKAKTGIIGTEYQSIRFDTISGVSLKRGMVMASLIIISSTVKYKVRLMEASGPQAEIGNKAVEFIRKKIENTEGVKTSDDPLDKLERLEELKNSGTISEEEFMNKKSELMDQI